MRGRVPPGDSMPAWASRLHGAPRAAAGVRSGRADRRRDRRSARGRHGAGRVTSPTRSAAYELLARQRACRRRCSANCIGFSAADPATRSSPARRQQLDALPAARVAAAVDRSARAVLGRRPALLRAIARAARRPAGERASRRVARRDPVPPRRQRRRGASCSRRLGAWNDRWQPPLRAGGVSRSARASSTVGCSPCTACSSTDASSRGWRGAGATVVTCPRSNRWTGAGTPPVERFYASGVRVAIGTDSLASVETLNLFDELAAVRALAPGVPAATLLESATRDGAAALGFGAELGHDRAGQARRASSPSGCPAGVEDVEEYLVSGIQPAGIRWLDIR